MRSRQSYFITQQLGRHRKSILAWSVIWTLLGLLFAPVYKSLSATAGESARIFDSLPPAVLKTVNISADYLSKPENFLSGQFLTVYLLAGSIYAVILGVNAVGGKVQDKTILTYLSKKLSRVSIFSMQAFVLMITIVLMNIVIACTLLISFSLFSGSDLSVQYVLATFAGAALTFICFAAIGLTLGVAMEKQHATAVGSGLAVISFFVNGLGALPGVPAWLQKCSIYYYFNTTHLRETYSLDSRTFVIVAITMLLLFVGARIFRKKDLYL